MYILEEVDGVLVKSWALGTNFESRRIRLSSFLYRIDSYWGTYIVVVDIAVYENVYVDEIERNLVEDILM